MEAAIPVTKMATTIDVPEAKTEMTSLTVPEQQSRQTLSDEAGLSQHEPERTMAATTAEAESMNPVPLPPPPPV